MGKVDVLEEVLVGTLDEVDCVAVTVRVVGTVLVTTTAAAVVVLMRDVLG